MNKNNEKKLQNFSNLNCIYLNGKNQEEKAKVYQLCFKGIFVDSF